MLLSERIRQRDSWEFILQYISDYKKANYVYMILNTFKVDQYREYNGWIDTDNKLIGE